MTLRLPRAAAFLISIAAGVGLTAGPALASTAGGGHDLSPQAFTLRISSDNPDGTVNAFGPVHGFGGTDRQVSETLDVFVFDHGSVNVRHSPSGEPRVDPRSCTATLTQFGAWKFDGGTGEFRHADGFGHFKLFEFAVLNRLHDGKGHGGDRKGDGRGRCDVKGEPKFFKVTVEGRGLATVGDHGHGH